MLETLRGKNVSPAELSRLLFHLLSSLNRPLVQQEGRKEKLKTDYCRRSGYFVETKQQ